MSDTTGKPRAIERLFFRPPLALARLGGSDTPLESFDWATDRTIHGSNRTVIRPAVSLLVTPDASLKAYRPSVIQFKDDGLLRPVAPFFELWVEWETAKGDEAGAALPLTSALLAELGVGVENLEFVVTVANRKAQRRTGSATCAFIAQASVGGDDHERKPLLAISPHTQGQEALVLPEHPIPLGQFQVIKAVPGLDSGIDLDTVRVRFTPAKGEVYGPATATIGPASPLPQGEALAPVTLGGRMHEIVRPDNRILNANTPWSTHTYRDDGSTDPQPNDSYDGANVGAEISWGVVDDTCDGIIEARLVVQGKRHVATTRVVSTCPDWAPDRRPFYSIADDLLDRDAPDVKVDDANREATTQGVADLFRRVFETASLMNLDALRLRAIQENGSPTPPAATAASLPNSDDRSMTLEDQGQPLTSPPMYASITADLFEKRGFPPTDLATSLPYAQAAQFAHARLCDVETLRSFLAGNEDRVRKLIRPPVGRFDELATNEEQQLPKSAFRDPRCDLDQLHDMRMPPYMRDCDAMPLSLSRRQYAMLMDLVKLGPAPPAPPAPPMPDAGDASPDDAD